jgi:glycerol kinase
MDEQERTQRCKKWQKAIERSMNWEDWVIKYI